MRYFMWLLRSRSCDRSSSLENTEPVTVPYLGAEWEAPSYSCAVFFHWRCAGAQRGGAAVSAAPEISAQAELQSRQNLACPSFHRRVDATFATPLTAMDVEYWGCSQPLFFALGWLAPDTTIGSCCPNACAADLVFKGEFSL